MDHKSHCVRLRSLILSCFGKPRCSHQQASTASNNNGDILFLPLHLLEKILLTLDTQTLIHCSFVCKDWNSFITSPDFMSRSSKRTSESQNEVMIVKVCRYILSEPVQYMETCFHECYSLHWDNDQLDLFHTMKTPTIDGFKTGTVVGTTNGLVCLADNLNETFVLWNPAIGKYAMLPGLMITWRIKRSNVGFGFDSRCNDFKVVKLIHCNLKLYMAFVFSYSTWSWKALTRSTCPLPCRCRVYKLSSPTLLNGVLHWIAWNIDRCYQFVLTFDLTHEVFGKILFPERISEFDGRVSIFTVGDSIALSKLVIGDSQIFRKWSVWVMKEYGVHESWINIVRSEEHFNNEPNQVLIPKYVLAIKKNGDIIVEMKDGQILSYDPITTRTNNVHGVEGLGVIKDRIFISYHTESLYLLEKRAGVNYDPDVVFYSHLLAGPKPAQHFMHKHRRRGRMIQA